MQSLGGGDQVAPVLASLDQIDGVTSSSVNGSGTVLRVSLRPGADPRKVARAVRRIVIAQVRDRVPVPLSKGAAARALTAEAWRDKSRVTALTAPELPPPERRGWTGLVALLLGCVGTGLGFVWWRQRSLAAAGRALPAQSRGGRTGSSARSTTEGNR